MDVHLIESEIESEKMELCNSRVKSTPKTRFIFNAFLFVKILLRT